MEMQNPEAMLDIAKKFSREKTLAMFEKMCLSRSFEFQVKRAFDAGLIRMPIYLSTGQEAISAALAVAFPRAKIFAQHRAHDFCLAYGGSPEVLADELLHRPTGCSGGMGGSASFHCPKINMAGHDGHIGTQVPLATGYAFGSGMLTLAVMGDAAAEEDWVLPALGYAETHRLPILFVCANNDLSILTKVAVRRSWKMTEVVRGLGMPAMEAKDDPWLIMHLTQKLLERLPAYLEVHCCRWFWHAGTGVDSRPEWNRFELVQEKMAHLSLGKEAQEIEKSTDAYIASIWNKLKEEKNGDSR